MLAPGTSSGLAWGGQPLDLWGLRVASAAGRDDWTEALLQHLDEYQSYGINALTVFYQGSSGGSVQAFSPDGRSIAPDVQRRMERLLAASADRQMVMVIGIFYQAQVARLDPENGAWLADRAAYPRAAEAVARSLAPYDHILLNVANEHTVGSFAGCPFPIRTAEGIVELCRAAKQGDAGRLVGSGGNHPGVNAELVASPDVDVLFFDSSGPSAEAVAAYRAIDPDKPLMNVEVFAARAQGFMEVDDVTGDGALAATAASVGASTPSAWPGGSSRMAPLAPGRRRVQGVFPQERSEGTHRGKADFLDEVAFAAQTPGFSLFGHFPGWYQGRSRAPSFENRFDLGGQGTLRDPGIRWYSEAVAAARAARSQQ